MSKSPEFKAAVQYITHARGNCESCRVLWDGFRHRSWCLWKWSYKLCC